MLTLKFIPADDEHESAIIKYNTVDVQMTEEGVQFFDPKSQMKRCFTYDKLISISLKVEISEGLRNKAINLGRIAAANSAKRRKGMPRATVN